MSLVVVVVIMVFSTCVLVANRVVGILSVTVAWRSTVEISESVIGTRMVLGYISYHSERTIMNVQVKTL